MHLVVQEGPGYLWHCLIGRAAWLDLVKADVARLQHALGQIPWECQDHATFLQQSRASVCELRRSLRPYSRKCLESHQTCFEQIVAKAKRLETFERSGGVVLPCG